MKITDFTIIRVLAVGLLVAGFSSPLYADTEFSAEMVQQGPQGATSAVKMYVGDQRVRTEMSQQGQQVVRITDEKRGIEWILLPGQKKYMEQRLGVPGGQSPGAKPEPAEDPCAGMPGLTCRKLGEEKVDGRTAVKWEIVTSHEGKTMKSTQWIDKERGVPLRQEMPNGQKTELKFAKKTEHEGRPVEEWDMVVTAPNQPETHTSQWFDPELNLIVRQKLPGGMVSELKDIHIGKQPDELFTVPAGYERMSVPQGKPGGPSGETPQD